MATELKTEKEITVEEKLKALFELQKAVSQIDEIKILRGELPLEVQDLEDEIIGRILKNNMLWYVGNVLLLYTSKYFKVL